jgi:hypothetical protein
MDRRLKSSFGTALKLIDHKHLGHSAAMAAATIAAFLLTPPADVFVQSMLSPQLWVGLRHRLLPTDERWFGIDWSRVGSSAARVVETRPAPRADAITTGSIPDRAERTNPAESK